MIEIIINENQGNQRVDRFLRKYFDKSPLSFIYKMIRKDIKVNGKRPKKDTLLKTGDQVLIYIKESDAKSLQKTYKPIKAKKQFKIAYEDENILIGEKPYGLLTHGDKNEKKNHLANQVIDYLIGKGEYNPRVDKTFSPSPVNRLDRNTTGLVIFGKNGESLQELNRLIREKDCISKKYLTVVGGKLEKNLHLRDRMKKDGAKNMVQVFSEEVEEGKLMETLVVPIKFSYIERYWFTLVEVEIITGRTHQIRAHLAQSGYPIIGDKKYGNTGVNRWAEKQLDLTTQFLHAYKLEFHKMNSSKRLAYLEGTVIQAEMPEHFMKIKKRIFNEN